MAFTMNIAAYGAVIFAGIALVVVGMPAERSVALQAQLTADKPVTPAYSLEVDKQVAAYNAAVGPHAALATASAAGVTLRSVGFNLPTSDRALPPGPGVELVTNNCTACHSAGMILNQPTLTNAEWTGEVNKMLNIYKAPVPQEDLAAIVAYLSSMKVAS